MSALFTLTLFGSIVWFWITAIIFLVVCFASDINKNGIVAFVTLIIIGFLFYFWGDVKSILAFFSLINVSIYLGIGLLFSAFRTFFSGRTLGKKLKNLPSAKDLSNNDENKYTKYVSGTKESEKESFIRELKGNVFRWWFMWPISMINWLITDLIKDTWDFVYSKIKGFYNLILELGIKSV